MSDENKAPIGESAASKYPVIGNIYLSRSGHGLMKYIGDEVCPDGCFMKFRAMNCRKEIYCTSEDLPRDFEEFALAPTAERGRLHPLQTNFSESGDLIAADATIAHQAQDIADFLGAEIGRLQADLDECDGDRWKLRTERDALRYQLAEREALLRDCQEGLRALRAMARVAQMPAAQDASRELLSRIDAALATKPEVKYE